MSVAWTTSLAFRESIVLDIQLDRFLLVVPGSVSISHRYYFQTNNTRTSTSTSSIPNQYSTALASKLRNYLHVVPGTIDT